MTKIKVDTASPYEVIVGAGAVAGAADFVSANFAKAGSVALVSDSNVEPLHGDAVAAVLESSGKRVERIVFPAGEKSKTLETYGALLDALVSLRFSRGDLIVALGGGVTGDLAGFAAATYMRGIDFIQIPTSLLAMVDSSVGGKTGVDLPGGKNLAGAFHQPRAVFCDTGFLRTLPEEWRIDGMGEVLKYAVLGDAELFASLERSPLAPADEAAIARCIGMKRDIVSRDERESGPRKLLNLGHTFAHAIEKLSGFSVSHGRAVATGVVMAAKASANAALMSPSDARRIEALAAAMGYETSCAFPAGDLREAMLSDKKAAAGAVDFVLPLAVGRCAVKNMSPDDVSWEG